MWCIIQQTALAAKLHGAQGRVQQHTVSSSTLVTTTRGGGGGSTDSTAKHVPAAAVQQLPVCLLVESFQLIQLPACLERVLVHVLQLLLHV